MKKLWLVLCLVLLTPMISKAESWMYEGKDDKGVQVYLDLDSISKQTPDSDVVSFKLKAELPTTVPSYVLGSVEINCVSKQDRVTKLVLWRAGVSQEIEIDTSWAEFPQGDVIWDRVLETACNWHPVK